MNTYTQREGSASEIYTNAVASLYNYIGGANESEGIQGTCRGIYDYNTLTTDEAIIPIRGGDWYDGGLWNAMYQHRWTEDDASLYDTQREGSVKRISPLIIYTHRAVYHITVDHRSQSAVTGDCGKIIHAR